MLALSGKWTATDTKTEKNSFADSYTVPWSKTSKPVWPHGSPNDVADSGSAIKTVKNIS